MTDFEKLLKSLVTEKVEFIIVGGLAANVHGSARLTNDIDILYNRAEKNISLLVKALLPFHPYLRGVPPGLPFIFDEKTILSGLNFTLTTDLGDIDLLGEIAGLGLYDSVKSNIISVELFGLSVFCIDLKDLIKAKRAAGRPKDLEAIAELELLLEDSLKD